MVGDPLTFPGFSDAQLRLLSLPTGADFADLEPKLKVQPPTEVRFPRLRPKTPDASSLNGDRRSLVQVLRTIERPTDLKIDHIEALGLHVISDAPPEDIIPERAFLPSAEWTALAPEDLEDLNTATQRPLNNGRQSPGAKTYCERVKELLTPNGPAFRTVRRQPVPSGEIPVRLGNAYEFFRNLELISGYWIDPTQPPEAGSEVSSDAMDIDQQNRIPSVASNETHKRIGTGSAMPADFRNLLLSSFTKLITYDFDCNVSMPRVEPRFCITSAPPRQQTSSFPSNITFVNRTPTDRLSARNSIIEGPLCALSSRPSTGFKTRLDEHMDLAREVIAVIITAQLRAREVKTEIRVGDGKWWCTKQRWGGGPGGPIGREGERWDRIKKEESRREQEQKDKSRLESAKPTSFNEQTKETSHEPTPAKKNRRNMPMYDAYRMVRPPQSTWDKKTRYKKIGAVPGADYDDIFLLSSINHHVSMVRVRVPQRLLDQLDGQDGPREVCTMWKSRWWDMFVGSDRVEAMRCIWGMMAYLMRKVDVENPAKRKEVGT